MFFDTLPDGELLLPVCIEAHEIHKMLSALEMYRIMVNKGKNYPAFEAVLNAIDYADNPQDSPCLDIEAGNNVCWAVDTTNSAIRFHPNDPFISIDLQDRPAIGQWERWEDSLKRPPNWMQNLIDVADDLSFFNKNIGYFPNDCFVVAPEENANDVTQFFDTLNALRQADFPYIEIEVRGTGELELHLLKVPFGGSAIIVWDIEFSITDFLWDLVNGGSSPSGNIIQTELEREILTLPPEANEENVIEIDFTEDIDHLVRVYFVPRFDYTALDFLGNGGGIREVSACDGLTLISPEGDTITKRNFKIGEFNRKGFTMATNDELIAEMCEAVFCGNKKTMLWLAERIALGYDDENIENDVILGAKGASSGDGVTINKTGTLSLPEYDTNFYEQANGAAYNQASMFARLFLTVDEQITASFTDALIQKSIEYTLSLADILTFNVFNYRNAGNSVVIDIDKLAESIYCTGSFADGLMEYGFDTNNHNASDLEFILDMASDIPSATLKDWYAVGKTSPLTLYTGYACYRLPSQSYTMTIANWNKSNVEWYTGSLTNRRYRVEIDVVSVFTNANGDTYDGMYYQLAGGNPSDFYELRLVKLNNGQVSNITNPSFLDGMGKYILEFTSTDAIKGTTFQGYLPFDNPTSGELQITIYDLGSI